MTPTFSNCQDTAEKLIQRLGKTIVIGVPIALGKPVGLLNALYQLASEDSSIVLTIITGLTLSRPPLKNTLEKNFLDPIFDRVLGNYVAPLYERARETQSLPPNIQVIEFFLSPGKFLHNTQVQSHFISSSYSHAGRDALNLSMNVLAQQVARHKNDGDLFSLSCNTDLFHELKQGLLEKEKKGEKIAIVGEVNQQLPYMMGETAEVNASDFTDIINTQVYPALFPVLREPLTVQDHLIGVYSSCLIKDDGCLQIGIGSLNVALANALIFRQSQNQRYQTLLEKLNVHEKFGFCISTHGETDTFAKGLYACTEMLSDEYAMLYKAGILRKKVYDHLVLQTLLSEQTISEKFSPAILERLIEKNTIHTTLTDDNVTFLKKWGIFKSTVSYRENQLILPSGIAVIPDLTDSVVRNNIISQCLGEHLQGGKIIHAGFYLGGNDFYDFLRNLSPEEATTIEMTSIARTNTLQHDEALLRLQHRQARFVNSCIMVNALGGVISDGLTNYQEISGVGGQYDFVSKSAELEDGCSIMNCRATRVLHGVVCSNIVWDYTNCTIPRYLRDVVITEYGIADCRSKTDGDVIKAMLTITDSRFQESLLNKAKKCGKIESDYVIPELFKNNYPEKIETITRVFEDLFTAYPFGSDFTEDEIMIAKALTYLKKCSAIRSIKLMVSSLFRMKKDPAITACLVRMRLDKPTNGRDFFYRHLLRASLQINRKQ